jgi:hypothetical protein
MESMKPDKKDAPKDLEDPKNEKAEKAAKAEKKPKKPKKVKGASDLPLLVELAFSLPVIVTIAVDLAVILVSLLSKATLVDILVRTMVTTIVIGALLLMVSWMLSTGALTAAYKLQEEPADSGHQEPSENHETMDLTKA